jgi:hypothetical protein
MTTGVNLFDRPRVVKQWWSAALSFSGNFFRLADARERRVLARSCRPQAEFQGGRFDSE